MKFSQYNHLVEFDGKFLLFNALSFKFLCLEPVLATLIEQSREKKDADQVRTVHPGLYEALLANRFIVDKGCDEFSEARQLMDTINNDKTAYRLILNPTVNCNFSCWYCYENHPEKTKMSPEVMQRVLKFIHATVSAEELQLFKLSFFGGEPLLYYREVILPVARYTADLVKRQNKRFLFDITTNGYLFNREKLEVLKEIGLTSCQITLDGNREDHNKTRFPSKKKGSFDTIVQNVKTAVRLGIEIVLRINYTEKNLAGLPDILPYLEGLLPVERQRITLSMNRVWQETNRKLGPEVNTMQESARAFGLKLPDSLLSDKVRNSCYADKTNEAVINYNGDVYKCNARDFIPERREGVLDEEGRIHWNESHALRIASRLANPRCRNCSILPICGAGCSQVALEKRGETYCINEKNDQNSVREQIIALFLSEHNQKLG